MDLGAFSVSLSVKDPEASRSFYEKFGFKVSCRGWRNRTRTRIRSY